MSDQFFKVQFNVHTDFQGADVILPDESQRRISQGELDEIRFYDVIHNRKASTRKMLAVLLRHTGKTLQDHVHPPALVEAMEKGVCRGKPSLGIEIGNRAYKFLSDDAWIDFDKLVFDIEFTVTPKKSS